MSTVNLLPQDFLQRRCQRRPNAIYIALFGVVMASIGGAALVSERSSRNTREVCHRINTAYADAARLIDEVHLLESQKKTMLDRAKMSAALMERLPRSYVLAMVTNALPDAASATSITLTVRTIKDTESEAKEKTKAAAVAKARQLAPGAGAGAAMPKLAVVVNVKGRATTDMQVARFIASLARHPLTDLVDLSYSKQASDKGPMAREFQLTVQLKPNADALDALKVASEDAPRQGPTLRPARPVPAAAAGGGA
jgi:Tfp pilus assembly protein PilN